MEIRRVGFEVRSWEGGPVRELMPTVDGVSLVELVASYEAERGFDVVGGYAGLVLDYFDYGDLAQYLTGRPESQYWAERGALALLGCECGEMGCWPLEARVAGGEQVTWSGFAQPHRPGRDYSGFGPFVFDRSQYEAAVRRIG